MLRVDTVASSLVLGHRFGGWLEVEPDAAAQATLERACLLEQSGAREEAIDLLGEALDDSSATAALFQARGALYLAAGFPRAAAGDFQRAVALEPARAACWFALGHAYETLGLANQALEALEHARGLGRLEGDLFLSLARVFTALGRSGAAARNYAAAREHLGELTLEVAVEVAVLAAEPERAAAVETLRARLEDCLGLQLSADGWFLRALLRELPPDSPREIAATFRALEVAPEELETLTRSLMLVLQLLDGETRAAARDELLALAPDEARRAKLERCLAQP
jgi:tetratricopeptide (TPR) repeat protein